MAKKTLYVVLTMSMFLYGVAHAQNINIKDSISKLNNTTDIKEKINLLYFLSDKLKYKKPEQAITYARTALKLSAKEQKAPFYLVLAKIYKRLEKKDSTRYYYDKAIEYYKLANNPNGLASAYMGKGLLMKSLLKKDSALLYYEKAEKSLDKTFSTEKMEILSAIKVNKANIYESTDKLKAIKELKEAEQLCLQNNIRLRLPDVYSNLANIFFDIEDYENALKYHKKSLDLDLEQNYHEMLAYDYSMISTSYLNLQQKDSALYYAEKSLEYAKKYPDPGQLCFSYLVLAGNQLEVYRYKESVENSLRSLALAKQIDYPDFQIYNYINLGTAYLHLNKDKKAIEALKNAEKLLEKTDIPGAREDLYDMMMRYYYKTGQLQEALKYSENLSKVRAENIDKKKAESIRDLEIKYQTQQKEAEILKLSNENLKKEAELQKTKNWVYLSTGTLTVFIGAGFFLWYRRKQKMKLELLENAFQATEEEKKRIGKELHDGIAGSLIRLVHEVEDKDVQTADKLLKTYNDIRSLSHQLNNTSMHNEVLYDRLLEIIPEDKEGKKFTLSIKPPGLKLEEPYGTHIFRIIQELITNNLKHSQASVTAILIEYKDNSLQIVYRDNGGLFNELKKGTGLHNIEDRVALMKGKIKYDFTEGFVVEIEVPYRV